MNPFVVGVTGPTGAGKGVLSEHLRTHGFVVLSADEASREVMQPGSPLLPALAAEFGQEVLHPDGSLNRGLLAERAFVSPASAQRLNALTHPAILHFINDRAAKAGEAGNRLIVLDAPLLFESGTDKQCGLTAAVWAEEPVRLARIMKRDGISEKAARQRIAVQPEREFYLKADLFVENNGDPAALNEAASMIARIAAERQKL